jgi:hypothetical protein
MANKRHRRIMLAAALEETAIAWLWNDEFTTPQASPLTSPRIAEVGTVTLTQLTGTMAVVARELVVGVGGAPSFASQRYFTAAQARAIGLGFVTRFNTSNLSGNGMAIGIYNTAAPAAPATTLLAGMQIGGAMTIYQAGVAIVGGLVAPSLSADHTLWVIMRGTGFFLLVDNVLEWVGSVGSDATLYAGFQNSNNNFKLTNRFAGVQLAGAWLSDYGIAVNRVISPINGEVMVGEANGTIEVNWPVVTGQTLEISFRRTDDNNRYLIRCIHGVNTMRLYKVEGGVESEITGGTTTQNWTNGTTYRIVIKLVGTALRSWVNTTARNVATLPSFNDAATGVKVAGSATLSNLIAWPYTVAEPLALPTP